MSVDDEIARLEAEIAAEMQAIQQQQQQPKPTKCNNNQIKIKKSNKRKSVNSTDTADITNMTEQQVLHEINQLEKQLKQEIQTVAQSVDDDVITNEIQQIEAEIERTASELIRQHSTVNNNNMNLCTKCLTEIDMLQKYTYIRCAKCKLLYHSACVDLTSLETACIYTFECSTHDSEGDITVQIRGDYDKVVDRYLSNIDESNVEQLEQYQTGLTRLMSRIRASTGQTEVSPTRKKKR